MFCSVLPSSDLDPTGDQFYLLLQLLGCSENVLYSALLNRTVAAKGDEVSTWY